MVYIPSKEQEESTTEDSCEEEEEDESARELEVLRQHVAMLNSELFQLKRVSRGLLGGFSPIVSCNLPVRVS